MTSEPQTKFRPRNPLSWPSGVVPRGKRDALIALLEDGEHVLWTGGPDPLSTMRTQSVVWWFGIPWLVLACIAALLDWIPKGWVLWAFAPGLALTAVPVLLAAYASGTVYAITNRRAIIRDDGLGKPSSVSVRFEDMDKQFEILPIRKGVGHLYFASGLSTKLSNVEHTGKLAFRELPEPEAVAALLERARKGH